ncbi:ankyrin repeat domain-containing protein 30B [Pan troglodytes]|uniref:ankyrin repeat domain-containing protein 30B n=1 Tax=Pan troglodytes TaxID=9598 RepID=UPI0030134967
MKRLLAAAGKGVRGPEPPNPFSERVYTEKDYGTIYFGDLGKIHTAASRGQVRKLEKMTVGKKPVNLNKRDMKKRTALHWACVNGHAEVVTFLVDRKCQLNVPDGEGRTPLMKALQCEREACANILIDAGADLNYVDVYGNTALHYAVYSENLLMVATLLSYGAVIELQNKASLTPLLLAIQKRSKQTVEFLLTKNANANAFNESKCTALMLAICEGSSEIVGMLLQQNVDVFAEDIHGITAERYAAACGVNYIHQQLLEHIRKLPKNPQNTNPEGTSTGTPDEAAPLVERTPDTDESLVEKTPDEAAPLAERTPDTDESLVEKTPDEAAPLAERTPDTDESLVEKTPDEPAPLAERTPDTDESLVEKTPDEAAPLAERTPDTAETLVEKTPDEAACLVEGTSAKIQCLGKATSGKFEQSTEETPKKILRPTKETSEKFSWPAKERPRKITWEEKETSVKTECVAGVTPNKTEVLEKGTSNMIACPTKETSTKASTNVDVSSVEPIFRLMETSASLRSSLFGTRTIENSQCTKVEEDFNLATKIISKSAAQNYMCLPDATYQKDIKTINHKIEDQMFPSESKREEDEEYSWDSGSLFESSAKTQVCIPESIYQKVMEINREVEELPEKPSAFKPAVEMQKTVPNKAFELKNEQTLRAAQMFPSESKQKDDEENSWDSESPCETVSQKDVYLPKATHQKEFDTLIGKLEESPVKDGLLKPTCGRKVSLPNKALELKDRETFKAESPDNDGLLKPTCGRKFSLPNKALELKDRETFKAAQMFPSESKQKDDEEHSWDFESFLETLLQNDVCLPKATHQKEFDTLSGKLEESPDKDGLLKPTCGMKISLPNKALELKDRETFKAVDVSSVESTFSLFGKPTTENSQSTKVEEDFNLTTKEGATKTVTGQQERDIGIIEQAPQDQTNKMPTSELGRKDDTKSTSDSEIISVSDTQNYECLPEATYQKEIKTTNGKIEESPEKPSHFEPATEMQNSVPNKGLEWKNKQTLRADSTTLSKILDAVPSCERGRELKKDHCEQITAKMEQTKNKFCVLQKELSEAKEIKSQLENQKAKWEQELCSVRLTLNQEEEKRRNVDILKEKIRPKEQLRKKLEVKQQLEQALRIQDIELKSVTSNLNQVSHTHESENDLFHENRMLKKEIAMLKLEIATLKHQHQVKENKYFEDIKILQEKNAELQMTLKLKQKTLTKRASQHREQLKVLTAENTMLTSKLKEKQDKEILETEIESHHPRLASALQDHDQSVTSRKNQELAFHSAGDAPLQGIMNVDVNNTIYNNEVLHQPLYEAQRKSKSPKINLNYAGDDLKENALVSEHAQRDRCETQCQMKKAEHMYQNEQDNVDKHTEQQESLEQKLFQLESKNRWLRQQLVYAHKKVNKSKVTINIQFPETKMQRHLKEKNEEVFNYGNHLKERIDQYEKEKAEREVIVRQLQKKLADLNKQCEASLKVTSHSHSLRHQ